MTDEPLLTEEYCVKCSDIQNHYSVMLHASSYPYLVCQNCTNTIREKILQLLKDGELSDAYRVATQKRAFYPIDDLFRRVEEEYAFVLKKEEMSLEGEITSKTQILSRSGDAVPSLNREKLNSIETILDSKYTVVKARAGSGKTTLLLALVSKLVKESKVPRDKILLLSFNKDVREKNTKALHEKWDVQDFHGVQTFHSLAFQIAKPDRTKVIEDQSNDHGIVELLGDIVRKEANVWFRLKYWWYLRELDEEIAKESAFTTLLGEQVKSFGEKVIADYLFEHGIEYKYEPSFDWGEHQYRPDFTIKDSAHDSVIEYWGKDDYEYIAQIDRKRAYWKEHGGLLIEMSHLDFEKKADRTAFERTLRDRVSSAGFTFRELSDEEKAERAFQKRFKFITSHLLSFIQFARAQQIKPEEVDTRISENPPIAKKDLFFAEMANHVYKKYTRHLEDNDFYDFPRMLEKAARIVTETSGECMVHLGPEKNINVRIKDIQWILADEFQDCSPILNLLIEAIRQTNGKTRFVCVGDDWQAINGFAGSETDYINSFNSYFPGASETALLTNFRSPQNIVDAGNNLMMGLGAPARSETQGGEVRTVRIPETDPLDRYSLMPERYITTIREIIQKYPANTEFAVLSRTNKFFTLWLTDFAHKIRAGFSGRKIDVSTVHKYKGREADVVIIVNATDRSFPLLHPDRSRHEILGRTDEKILQEERRLFYVAVTRAKAATYILTEKSRESPFIADLSSSNSNK